MRYIDFAQVKTRAAAGEAPSITITTPRVDWDRDRAIPERLRMAPEVPVLWAHDYLDLPVGRSVSSALTPDGSRRALFRWLENDERAAAVRNAFEQDMLAASIGVRGDWAEPNEFGGHDFGGDIVEFSLCSVPANPDCVRQLKSLGIWKREAVTTGPRTMEGTMTAVDREFSEMDLHHTAVQVVEEAYDRLDIRGAMGTVPPRPDFRAMDEGYRAPETRGWGGLSPAQQELFNQRLRHARGIVGPSRAHRGNLTGGDGIDIEPGTVTEVVRGIVAKLLQDLGPTIDQQVRAALARARGRRD